MHLDSQKSDLDKVGQTKVSNFFVNNYNKISLFLGDLDTKKEEHIGEIYKSGLVTT